MIFILLLACVLVSVQASSIPTSGFGTPTYLVDLGIISHIVVPCIFACLVLLVCYPNHKALTYQMSLISITGVCLGLHHMILGSLPNGIQNMVLILAIVVVGILSFRGETKILVHSIANTYMGGYLVLMLLGIKQKITGIPIMVVYGLLIYFVVSTVEAVFVNIIRSTSCTFFFLCFLAPLGIDTFNSMLSYSFYQFNVMRIISAMIVVGAFVFFFCLPVFINVIMEKLNSSPDSKLKTTVEKDEVKVEV